MRSDVENVTSRSRRLLYRPKEIADNFINVFVDIGLNLAIQNKNPISYLTKSLTNSLFLNPVTSDEFVKLIVSLKSSNAHRWHINKYC